MFVLIIVILLFAVIYDSIKGNHNSITSSSEYKKTYSDNDSSTSTYEFSKQAKANEKFYNYITSLSQDDLETRVLYYYNTYKGFSNLCPIMGEFGSIEFVNLILLIDYCIKSNKNSLFDSFVGLNFDCLIALGYAFNHMSPGEFSDRLDAIINVYPEIIEYADWSKGYIYLRDYHKDWIHKQEFAYGTPEWRTILKENPFAYDSHFKDFAYIYNGLDDNYEASNFYKRQGLGFHKLLIYDIS